MPPTSILWISYFYPTNHVEEWDTVNASFPTGSIAIINPSSGEGTSQDPNYRAQLVATRAAGLDVIGYVSSDYCNRDLQDVLDEIDRLYDHYGGTGEDELDGIFLDETNSDADDDPDVLAYLEAVRDKVWSKAGKAILCINPGTRVDAIYADLADIIMVFEGSASSYIGRSTQAWELAHPDPDLFVACIHGATESQLDTLIGLAHARNHGRIYVCETNAYNVVPSYSAELVAKVAAHALSEEEEEPPPDPEPEPEPDPDVEQPSDAEAAPLAVSRSRTDPRARLRLPLNEQATSIYPVDASGYLGTLARVGTTAPLLTAGGASGVAREFVRASAHGFRYASDEGRLRLTRDLTIAALLRVDAATMGEGAVGTIIQRGRGGDDPIAFALLAEVGEGVDVTLRLRWETSTGAIITDAGVTVAWPAGEYLFVVATREVVDGQFHVRYYVNFERSGVTSHSLNCAGADEGEVSIGCGMTTAPAYADHFDGALDTLEVLGEAMSPEEAEWLWYRIAKDQPDGAAGLRRLLPPGVYSQDPESYIQREVAVEGAALGYAKSVARRVRDYSMPDKAWGEQLARWEALTEHSPKAGDWLQRRRDRVLRFLGAVRGYSITDLQEQLLEPLDLDDPEEVEIIEYDNDFMEDFSAGTPSIHAKVMGGNGAWSSDSAAVAALYLQYVASSDDLRHYDRERTGGGLYLWSLGHGTDALIRGQVDPVSLGVDTIQGFAIGKAGAEEDWLFVGLADHGGAHCVATLRARGGQLDDEMTVIETPWTADPTHFSILSRGDGTYLVRFGATVDAAAEHAGIEVEGPVDPLWAGFCCVSQGDKASVSLTCRFRQFKSHTPRGPQRLYWYAFRDPGYGGNPDMAGARLLVDRLRPAHTIASAVEQLSVLCDDPGSGCDREPIGA